MSIDQEHGTQQTLEFSRSEKEWQQPIQWDSLVVMATLLNGNASAHCCNRSSEAEKKEKNMIFFSFSCQSDWTD